MVRWTNDADAELHEGEFDPTHRKMAYVAGDTHQLLRIYRTPEGLYPYHPRGCYQLQDPVGGRFSGPSWSPDGTKLAFGQGDGIHVADVPALTTDPCSDGATLGRLLIPGATSADWGPADVPPARVVQAPPRTPAPLGPRPEARRHADRQPRRPRRQGDDEEGARPPEARRSRSAARRRAA